MELCLEKDKEPPLPPIDGGDYLIDYLMEVGPTVPAGMGEGAVSFTELETWARTCSLDLSGWEFRTLRRLSLEYAVQIAKSRNQDCPPPWQEYTDPERRKSIAKHIRSVLRG